MPIGSCCSKRALTFLIYVLVALFSFAISALEWIYQEPTFFDPLSTKLFIDNFHNLTSKTTCPNIIYYNRFNTSSTFSNIHSPEYAPAHTPQGINDSQFEKEQEFQLFEMVVTSPNHLFNRTTSNRSSTNSTPMNENNHFESLIILFHSHGEYSERYCLFFDEFYKVNENSDQIAFYTYDMRGHGYSSGLGRSFWRNYHQHLQDMDQIIEERIPFILNHVLLSPNAKVYFVAHSTSVLNLLWNDYLNSQHLDPNHYNPLKTFKTRVKNFSGVFLSSPTISMTFIYNQVFWITPYGKGNSESNFEYYKERIERAISNFNLNVLKFIVVPVLRIFPSLPLCPPFGIPCGQPKCRERFMNDTIIYKEYWKSSTSISILEEMRNVKILLASFNPDQSQSLQDIPTLVVYGEDDSFFLWDETKYLFSKHFKNITWKSYPNLKHDVFHEDFKEPICRDLYNLVSRK